MTEEYINPRDVQVTGGKYAVTGIVGRQPSVKTMTKWVMEGYAKATDDCTVEPDGYCEHGKPSWLIVLGLI